MDIESWQAPERPLFGVVTTSVASRRHAAAATGGYRPKPIWLTLEQRAHELGLQTIFFHPNDADFSRGRVHGWVCERGEDDEEIWRRRYRRLPDVVFDNVFVHLARRPDVLALRRHCVKRGIPLFNPTLGSKTELADWLRRNSRLWRYHPDTVAFTEGAQALDFLTRYPSVYLKPVYGSAGSGILELTRSGTGYRVRAAKYGSSKKPLDRTCSRAELLRFLRRERARHTFILQQGCDLLHVDGSKIDLRIHLQRDKKGEWVTVALIVKQGQPDSIVSNYHAGGATRDWEWLEREAERQGVELPTRQHVISLSEAIAAAYAKKAPTLASLGLDIGIDRKGDLWLLDVNSRPGRNILDDEQKVVCQRLNAEFASYLIELR